MLHLTRQFAENAKNQLLLVALLMSPCLEPLILAALDPADTASTFLDAHNDVQPGLQAARLISKMDQANASQIVLMPNGAADDSTTLAFQRKYPTRIIPLTVPLRRCRLLS